MTDLQTLRAALTPDDPSPDAVDRSRHRLQNHMLGEPAPRKRTGWLTAGTGLTVAAAAVAIATIPATPVSGPPATTVDDSLAKTGNGQEILLAAAAAAERSPDGSGEYWHVKLTRGDGGPSNVYEYWIKPDGRSWSRGAKTQGEVRPNLPPEPNSKPFRLAAISLTLDELRALPTDPNALTAWIAEALKHSGARTSAGELTDDDRKRFTFSSLIALVSAVPAPPEVRAAAFRAIAAYPDVTSLGEVPGGQGLQLPANGRPGLPEGEGYRLVVDPSTGRVNRTSILVFFGAEYLLPDTPAGARIDAEWTNTLPA